MAASSAADGTPNPKPGNLASKEWSGELFVISAPSGAGKSTLIRSLFNEDHELSRRIAYSVSHATRPPRPGEVHGKDYYFVDIDAFLGLIEDNAFLEWADVHGQLKGTSHLEVERLRGQDRDVLLEIDVQGARQVRAKIPEAVTIFILPPSYQALETRLRGRDSDSEAQIRRRLADAVQEIRGAHQFDYVILNEDLAHARAALAAVLRASRQRRERMQPLIDRICSTLPDEGG